MSVSRSTRDLPPVVSRSSTSSSSAEPDYCSPPSLLAVLRGLGDDSFQAVATSFTQSHHTGTEREMCPELINHKRLLLRHDYAFGNTPVENLLAAAPQT